MAQIPSLPSISVEIAFNPTNIFTTTQTWTDVSAYVRTMNSTVGRQHMLDRFEAGTLRSLVNNRLGEFSTTHPIRARLPIKVSATWSSVSYPIFYGLIDEPDLKQADAVNVDYSLQASDYLKMLSLTYMDQPDYYGSFVNTGSGNAVAWYRMDSLANPTVSSTSSAAAVTNTLVDSINGYNGVVSGTVDTTPGVLVYDTSVACDLTGGSGNVGVVNGVSYGGVLNLSSAVRFVTDSPSFIDFWLTGLNARNATLVPAYGASGGSFEDVSVTIDGNGFLNWLNVFPGPVTMTVNLADGNWHHVGVGVDWSASTYGTPYAVVDGVAYIGTALTSTAFVRLFDTNNQLAIGSGYSLLSGVPVANWNPTLAAYVDEIVLSFNTNAGVAVVPEVQARYVAGSRMLTAKGSADMVNDILQVAGFAGLAYQVDYGTYTAGSWQGTTNVNGWTSTVTNSSALDLILLVCDTECGAFFQTGNGTFQFLTRDYQNLAANLTPVCTFTNYDNSYSNQVFYDAPNLQVLEDDMDLWTTVKVTPTNGNVQRFDASATVKAKYGASTLVKSTQPTTLAAAIGEAQYWGLIYGAPLTRVGAALLGSETNHGALLPFMLGAAIYERASFVYRDPVGTVTQSSMLVESFTHDFDSELSYWHSTFVLDPYPISNPTPFMIWDDATNGIWDTNVWI